MPTGDSQRVVAAEAQVRIAIAIAKLDPSIDQAAIASPLRRKCRFGSERCADGGLGEGSVPNIALRVTTADPPEFDLHWQ
jgi:hypothetical protein